MAESGHETLVDALTGLRAVLDAVALPLDLPGAVQARADLARVRQQLDDHLLPRLRDPGAPVLVVVGGSTGAGKSTLVNALVGAQVSTAGVLRPTTRWPVLVHHPDDASSFDGPRVLARLTRSTSDAGTGARGLRLVASDTLPQGLALLDAPDIDSVDEANRALAVELLGAADVWLFVTTPARYADAVPWDLLAEATRRRTHLAVVLDRVDATSRYAVERHLRSMLDERGLAGAAVLVVPEVEPDRATPDRATPDLAVPDGPDAQDEERDAGLLPERAVAQVADWLTALALDPQVRDGALSATRDGAAQDVVVRARSLADALDEQRAAADRLAAAVEHAYAAARAAVVERTSDGSMLRGEVLSRWQDVVGTGEWFRAIDAGVSRLRDRIAAGVRGRRAEKPEFVEAVGHGLEAVVLDAAEQAAAQAHATWYHDPAGAPLLDGLALSRASADLRGRVDTAVRDWQGDVLDLVRGEGAGKRATARALSFGVNGLGMTLMVAVFASTGGVTGAEVGIVGGTALLAQRLLEAVFGDEAVRRLTRTAHERLDERVGALLDDEADRFGRLLVPVAEALRDGGTLRAAATRVQDAARTAVRGPQGSRQPAGASRLRGAGLGPQASRPDLPAADVTPGTRRSWWRRPRRGEPR